MPPAWIDPRVLEWYVFLSSWEQGEEGEVRRPYQQWHHAERLVETATSEFQRTDVVTTLKRAVDNRLRLLNKIYRFKAIPVTDKPDDLVENLAFFGIVRPLLISELLEVRNRVEHEDAEPPTQSRCRELVEFVWYFIRCTDLLVRQIADDFELTDADDSYGLTVELRPHDGWVLRFSGWLPSAFLSTTDRSEWVRVDLQGTETAGQMNERHMRELGETYHSNREGDDLHVEGRILGPGSRIKELLSRYFERA